MSISRDIAHIIARYKTPEDVDNARFTFTIPKDHFCWGCAWGKAMPDRFVCPFVAGSCVRIPSTLIEPNIPLVSAMIHHYNRVKVFDAHAVKEMIEENSMKAE